MKRYLLILLASIFMFISLSAAAEIGSTKDLALKKKAERERLLRKTEESWVKEAEESWIKSGKPKLVEFLSPNVEDPLKKKYLEMVLQRLNEIANKYYPEKIVDLKEPQTIVVSFSLGRTGNLINTRIMKPSKHKIINDYMLRVLKRGQPFPSYVEGAFSDRIEEVVITKPVFFNSARANSYKN